MFCPKQSEKREIPAAFRHGITEANIRRVRLKIPCGKF
jgi:hypothetical protein